MNNVVSLSGGKDSTAMLHMMLERGENIHSAVFFDTGWEFPEMAAHIDLVEQKTGVKLIRLKSKQPFEYWMYDRIKAKGKRQGEVGYGWPNNFDRWCTELKTREILKYKRKIKGSADCVGFAADEVHRVKPGKRYPLIEYGMTEKDAIKYCRSLGYNWGGLYDIFDRVSCWCCPLQSLKDLRKLRKFRPELWQQLIEMDMRQPRHNPGFKEYATAIQLETRFRKEDRQLKMWEVAA
jgi:3'-phosphoadenosine 5'-phosphosulfate sulfotransferase (PAPS reductase)/FAD synthetase